MDLRGELGGENEGNVNRMHVWMCVWHVWMDVWMDGVYGIDGRIDGMT